MWRQGRRWSGGTRLLHAATRQHHAPTPRAASGAPVPALALGGSGLCFSLVIIVVGRLRAGALGADAFIIRLRSRTRVILPQVVRMPCLFFQTRTN